MPSVLIIDDHEGTLDTYSTILRLAGFETVAAGTGRAGIALAIARAFDVIRVDLRLPAILGIDVVRELKLSGVSARMVIVTAFPEIDSSFDAAAVGADGYVEGPCSAMNWSRSSVRPYAARFRYGILRIVRTSRRNHPPRRWTRAFGRSSA